MVYSLTRFLHHQPACPFFVGGILLIHGEDHFLVNADTQVRLLWDEPPPFNSGDLVEMQVKAVKIGPRETAFAVSKSAVNLVHRASDLMGLAPGGGQALLFGKFLARVRQFFIDSGFCEIRTPFLVPCPGLEPSLEPFATDFKWGKKEQRFYLPTSPEIQLKKVLAHGWTDIFEIKTCFRNGERGSHHLPEFQMLEWYRGFADLDSILNDLRALLAYLNDQGFPNRGQGFTVTTFKQLFQEYLDFDLKPDTTQGELRALCEQNSLDLTTHDSWSDLFHRLLLEKIEPNLPSRGPLVVRDFPHQQAALAKITSEGWADRAEFYWQGLEIANGFNEVIDSFEQTKRWQRDQQERTRLGTTNLPEDPELILALKKGIPPTGGIALGLERLFMAITQTSDIRETRFIPWKLHPD